MKSRIFSFCMLALAGSSCTTPADLPTENSPNFQEVSTSGVTFVATEATYEVGDTALIVLRNATSGAVGYNLCASARELRGDDGWDRYEPFRICTAELRTLAPGEEETLVEPITGEWKAGQYRMVTRVWPLDSNAGDEVFTPPFSVRD